MDDFKVAVAALAFMGLAWIGFLVWAIYTIVTWVT
jgi:hypothetical protein